MLGRPSTCQGFTGSLLAGRRCCSSLSITGISVSTCNPCKLQCSWVVTTLQFPHLKSGCEAITAQIAEHESQAPQAGLSQAAAALGGHRAREQEQRGASCHKSCAALNNSEERAARCRHRGHLHVGLGQGLLWDSHVSGAGMNLMQCTGLLQMQHGSEPATVMQA